MKNFILTTLLIATSVHARTNQPVLLTDYNYFFEKDGCTLKGSFKTGDWFEIDWQLTGVLDCPGEEICTFVIDDFQASPKKNNYSFRADPCGIAGEISRLSPSKEKRYAYELKFTEPFSLSKTF